MVKHIKMKHTDVLVGMTAADSSGTDAKMTSESSDDDGTSGTNENEETFMVSFDDDDGKPKKRKKSVVKTFKFSTREQFTDDCDVYRESKFSHLPSTVQHFKLSLFCSDSGRNAQSSNAEE